MYFDSRKNLEVAINLFYKWDCYDTECTKTKPVCGSLTKIILERRQKWGPCIYKKTPSCCISRIDIYTYNEIFNTGYRSDIS